MNENTHPVLREIPIGIKASGTRRESDSMGDIEVPADRYWGAQTQRSLIHFSIGDDRMPKRIYHAYGYVKKAAAVVPLDVKATMAEAWIAAASALMAVVSRSAARHDFT